MAVFKCKMCGATLDVDENQTVVACEYCSTQQTLPKFDDERKISLFNRANHLRFNCEFDKAAGIYESVVAEFSDEAEAYWGLVLCKYGIEYVNDSDGKKIPTCHRTLPTSIMDDDAFALACDYAAPGSKSIYRNEAKAIEQIQQKILKIAANEEPYDIFICYKETDDITGSRTEDSSIAQDIYTELIKDGYKVFFSRVTLREVAGTEYEPYIYAALSSAKIMLAIGTKYEYYDAVWVKNEWSRFISMIGDEPSKVIIPCYRNMDAYDMPKEFKNMQALDMGDVTFFASLNANIKRLLPKEKEVKETVVLNSVNVQAEPLLKRAFMFLEDGDFARADDFCEQVLNIEPENADAYLVKLMIELRVRVRDDLKNLAEPFKNTKNYQKVLRYGDESLIKELNGYIEYIIERNENDRVEGIYIQATEMLRESKTESSLKKAANKFNSIIHYKDSASLAELCIEKAEMARKDAILFEAKNFMVEGNNLEEISYMDNAVSLLEKISGWKDADEIKESALIRKSELETIKIERERLLMEKQLEKKRQAEEKKREEIRLAEIKKAAEEAEAMRIKNHRSAIDKHNKKVKVCFFVTVLLLLILPTIPLFFGDDSVNGGVNLTEVIGSLVANTIVGGAMQMICSLPGLIPVFVYMFLKSKNKTMRIITLVFNILSKLLLLIESMSYMMFAIVGWDETNSVSLVVLLFGLCNLLIFIISFFKKDYKY